MTYAPPSRNIAEDGTLSGAFRLILTKFLQGVDDMLPATVISYNRTSNRAEVQPLIAFVDTNGQQINRAAVASIPVMILGAGNCLLSFDINPGDLGWIKANDRDISLFKKNYVNSAPNTRRKHKFMDAVFIPDVMRGYTINPEDSGNAVLQTKDGTVRIAIWPNKVKMTAPQVLVDTPLMTVTGTLNVQNVNGSSMPCIISGSIHASGDIVAGAISLEGHVHTGVTTGGGDTGGPI